MTKTKWFFLANDLDTANKAIKTAYSFSLVFAVIQMLSIGGLSDFSDPELFINLFDPIFIAALAYVLYLKPSRLAAICLFLTSIFIAYVTFANRTGIDAGGLGVTSILFPLFLLYAGFQGMVGTYGYHKFSKTSVNVKAVALLTFITVLYSLVVFCFIFIMALFFLPQTEQYLLGMSEEVKGMIFLAPMLLIIFLSSLGVLPFTKNISVVTVVEAKV